MFLTYHCFVAVRYSVPRYVTAIDCHPPASLHIPTSSVPTDTMLSSAWQKQLYCKQPGISSKRIVFVVVFDTVAFCNTTFHHVVLCYLSNSPSLYTCNVQFVCMIFALRESVSISVLNTPLPSLYNTPHDGTASTSTVAICPCVFLWRSLCHGPSHSWCLSLPTDYSIPLSPNMPPTPFPLPPPPRLAWVAHPLFVRAWHVDDTLSAPLHGPTDRRFDCFLPRSARVFPLFAFRRSQVKTVVYSNACAPPS